MRRIFLVGLALAVVVGLTIAWSMARDDSGDGGKQDGEEPGAPASAPAGVRPVYHLADAEIAVPGEDYRVLHQVPGSIAHKAELLLADSTLVLLQSSRYDRTDGTSLPDLLQLWDPETGHRETLPRLWPSGVSRVTASSAEDIWVSFTERGPTHQLHQVMHYDRRTGAARVITTPYVARAKNPRVDDVPYGAADGRIYFVTGSEPCLLSRPRCENVPDHELWSFDPDAPGRLRKEADDVGAYAVSPTQLAWVDPQDGLDDEDLVLHVREQGSRTVHTATVRDCWFGPWVPVVQVTDRWVLLQCGRLFDARARQVTRLAIYSHDLSGMTQQWIAWGWTILDPENGRLLQISDGRIWHERPVAMAEDLILFPTGTKPPNTRGGTWTLARLPK